LIQYEAEEVGKKTGFLTAKELRQAKEAARARAGREEEGEVTGKKGIVSAGKFCELTNV
jgi:DNA-directed RNA polymerase III subunit RPC3